MFQIEGRRLKKKRQQGRIDCDLTREVVAMVRKVRGVVIMIWMMMILRRVSTFQYCTVFSSKEDVTKDYFLHFLSILFHDT
jgi:hypothetical protein